MERSNIAWRCYSLQIPWLELIIENVDRAGEIESSLERSP
jgi:hypothetical protein